MAQQIWALQHTFKDELAAIKNNKCEFIAFTEPLAKEFSFTSELLGKTAARISFLFENTKVYSSINNQEQKIIADGISTEALWFNKHNGLISIYTVYKKPLINPYTNDIVGIFINTVRFVPNLLRIILHEQILLGGKSNAESMQHELMNLELTPLQQQLIFCILIGFTARKDITSILNHLTGEKYNEIKIKNTLQALYIKFNCSTTIQLIELIIKSQIKLNLPETLLKSGFFTTSGSFLN
jgi:hypothetical protein